MAWPHEPVFLCAKFTTLAMAYRCRVLSEAPNFCSLEFGEVLIQDHIQWITMVMMNRLTVQLFSLNKPSNAFIGQRNARIGQLMPRKA